MELNDLVTMKSLLGNNTMTPYEQFKVGHMQSRHASGTSIAGLCVGIGAAVLAVGAGAWAGSRAKAAKDLAEARADATQRQMDTMLRLYEAERSERISGDQTITQTVTDTVSGSQSGQLTAMQQAELAASQIATQNVMTGLMTGRYSENPQKVSLYSAPQPCGCPCNG